MCHRSLPLLLVLASIGVQNAQSADSAKEVLGSFRKGWKPAKGYMRPPNDRGWQVRMAGLCGLVKLKDQAVPVLTKALADPSAKVRAFAAQALGFVASSSPKAQLERALLQDKDPITRLYAADALGMMGGLAPKPAYDRVAKQDANRDVRAHVRFALERKGAGLPASVQEAFARFDLRTMATAQVGKTAPDFTLLDTVGKSFKLSSFRGKNPVVLLFIYGDT